MKLYAMSIAAGVCTATAAGQISDPYITFNVSNANGSGTYTVPLAHTFPLPSGGVTYTSGLFDPFPLVITDGGGATIATINSINAATIDDDTSTSNGDGLSVVNFVMSAGSLDTTVEVVSSFVTTPFAYGPTPTLFANAALTASDDNGDGVEVSGAGPLAEFYVNGDVNSGDLFTTLTSGFSGGSFSSPSTSESSGAVVFGQSVSSFQFRSEFTITATDEVSGNYSFTVNSIPAPATAAVLTAGMLAGARRRR